MADWLGGRLTAQGQKAKHAPFTLEHYGSTVRDRAYIEGKCMHENAPGLRKYERGRSIIRRADTQMYVGEDDLLEIVVRDACRQLGSCGAVR